MTKPAAAPALSPAYGLSERRRAGLRRRTGTASSRAILLADDVLETRPDLVDRADLHVDPPVLQREVADHVLVEVGRQPGAPLRPGDPERAGLGGQAVQHRPAIAQPGLVGAEAEHHVVRASAGPPVQHHAGREVVEGEVRRRAVDQHRVSGRDVELAGQRGPGVTGHTLPPGSGRLTADSASLRPLAAAIYRARPGRVR